MVVGASWLLLLLVVVAAAAAMVHVGMFYIQNWVKWMESLVLTHLRCLGDFSGSGTMINTERSHVTCVITGLGVRLWLPGKPWRMSTVSGAREINCMYLPESKSVPWLIEYICMMAENMMYQGWLTDWLTDQLTGLCLLPRFQLRGWYRETRETAMGRSVPYPLYRWLISPSLHWTGHQTLPNQFVRTYTFRRSLSKTERSEQYRRQVWYSKISS